MERIDDGIGAVSGDLGWWLDDAVAALDALGPAAACVVRAQPIVSEELDLGASLALAAAGGHVEAATSLPGFTERTAPVEVAAGQSLVVLVRSLDRAYFHRRIAQQTGRVRVVAVGPRGPASTMVELRAGIGELPRRFEVMGLPPGAYWIELVGRSVPSLPPALLQACAFAQAGALGPDADLQVAPLASGGAAAAAAAWAGPASPGGYLISPPVSVTRDHELIAEIRLAAGEPGRTRYLQARAGAPATVNHTAVVRAVAADGRAVAHLELDAARLPLALTIPCRPGDYRLAVVTMIDRTRRAVPVAARLAARPRA